MPRLRVSPGLLARARHLLMSGPVVQRIREAGGYRVVAKWALIVLVLLAPIGWVLHQQASTSAADAGYIYRPRTTSPAPLRTTSPAAVPGAAASVTPSVGAAGIVSSTGFLAGSGSPQASQMAKKSFRTYVVKQGDTLGDIAERHGVNTNTLIWANDLEQDPDRLRIGQELLIPPGSGVTHVVVEGDTVSALAQWYDVTPDVIVQANDIRAPFVIVKGQKLFIPGGVKPPPTSGIALGRFMWPTSGAISFRFREDGNHKGLDIANQTGTTIVAADGGIVTTSLKQADSYGWHVIIDHLNGFSTVYGHLSLIGVDAGDRVRRGDLVGLMGNTGYSTGPHLHFEVRLEGVLVDPLAYLP